VSTVVTGACGFVGCNLVEHLLERGRTVVALDRAEAWPPDAAERFRELPGRLAFAAADVRDAAALDEAFATAAAHGDIEGVIHAAAITPGPEREARDADLIAQVNYFGTIRVLAAARAYGARRLLYPSSASVYGDAAFPDRPLDEALDAPIPNAVYGIAKYAAERSALRLGELWGIDVVAARVGAVFGPWERDTGLRDTFSGPMLATRAMLRGERVVLTREGPRDWVYAADVAAALVALLDAPEPAFDLYHVSAGRRWTLADWCRALAARLGSERFGLDPDPANATVPLGARDRSPLGIERLLSVYRPRFGLDQALPHYLGWLDARSRAWHEAW
jgi:nucleoside-diphosphate-sugar epimerase